MRHATSVLTRASLVALACLMPAAALRAQSVHTDYDHKVNFAQYHTFSIYRVHASDQIVERRLHDDMEQGAPAARLP